MKAAKAKLNRNSFTAMVLSGIIYASHKGFQHNGSFQIETHQDVKGISPGCRLSGTSIPKTT